MQYLVEETVMASIRGKLSEVCDRLTRPFHMDQIQSCVVDLRNLEARLIAPGQTIIFPEAVKIVEDPDLRTKSRKQLKTMAKGAGYPEEDLLGKPVKKLIEMVSSAPSLPPRKKLILKR